MKRSEMLEVLKTTLDTYNSDCDLSVEECLLNAIEQSGMAPPGDHYLPTSVPGQWIKCSGGIYGTMYLNRWEPE